MDRRSGFLVGRVLAVAGVGLVAFIIAAARSDRGGCGKTPIIEDQNRLRMIAGLFVVTREFPTRDGFIDPYKFVRDGNITRENFGLFRSDRLGIGPTDAEIERGDYTNFPWERCRGEAHFGVPVFPLLWERRADRRGGVIVALSDGSAKYCEREDFAIRRQVGLVAQLRRLPMRDGAFDPYAFVREGLVPADLLRPTTDAEIARGDYANFPWDRYRGDGRLDGPPFPLLWERRPDQQGRVLAGLSDGTIGMR
jgi:hypothetical protein